MSAASGGECDPQGFKPMSASPGMPPKGLILRLRPCGRSRLDVTESAILEQRENLPRLRHGVVDVEEREHRIEEAEAAIIFGAEGVLEHEHADSLDRLAPVNDFRAIQIQPTAA